ncbi:MAG: hypothetical protein H6719_12005 [Sandaracinaceae bacterium]|nr:hypothetical protein [Sandaracinaceae bacterium]
MIGRITFPKNPWPDGHALASFAWTARVEPKGLFFELDLRSADYDAEAEGAPTTKETSWESPIVWNNYHACHLHADGRGFLAATEKDPLDLDRLEGRTFRVDTKPKPWDDAAFHIYLLGHDSVAKHEITFGPRHPDGAFSIDWKAKVCLSYAGATRYAHALHARVERAKLEAIRVPRWEYDEERARAALARVMPAGASLFYARRGRGFAFAEGR